MEMLKIYTQNLLSRGQYFFTKQDAIKALSLRDTQFRYQAHRLAKNLIIRRVFRDFYVIIPAEHRALKSLPPSWIINALMRHLKREYYVGLLSAASYYGATEQQPMTFQVIIDAAGNAIRPIKLPRGTIEFHIKKTCKNSLVESRNVPTGVVAISTPEQTICDLIAYYLVSGGMSNVALVIKELALTVSVREFKKAVKREKNNSVLQRLGYVLEYIGQLKLADIVEQELLLRGRLVFVFFRPDFYKKEGPRNARWKLIINDYMELE